MNLFINYYDNPHRQHELLFCLEQNLAHDLIERIIVFNESASLPKHKKIVKIPSSGRPTFQAFFNETRKYGADDINIITNSDIFFDGTLKEADRLHHHMVYAITRHELRGDTIHKFHLAHPGVKAKYSQDTWIFRGPINHEGFDNVIANKIGTNVYESIPFTMGVPGCDNILAAKLKQHYQVKNPMDYITCIHNHQDNNRPSYVYRMTGQSGSQWGEVNKGHLEPGQL